MYKISVNEIPLFLMDTENGMKMLPGNDKNIINRYSGRPKSLHAYIDLMEKSPKYEAVVVYSSDLEQLFMDFCSLFKMIEAAGGIVKNENNEILFIYRRGYWDLPKGKIDLGESTETAAIREINEETGIEQMTIEKYLAETWHVYKMDNKKILKKTYWYLVKTSDTKLVPQTEEDIEVAVWMTKAAFLSEKRKVYGNILDLLEMVD